jgi:hypothetical protein
VDYCEADVSADNVQPVVNSDSEPEAGGYHTALEYSFESLDNSSSSLENLTVVEEEEEVTVMANPRIIQLVAELNAVYFQLEEQNETVQEELQDLSVRELTMTTGDMKELRVTLVKLGSELKLLSEDIHGEHAQRIQELLDSSKKSLAQLKSRQHSIEATKVKSEATRQQEVEMKEKLVLDSKILRYLLLND